MTPLHVYFSGAISAGREDVGLYRMIVDRLRAAGCRVFAGDVTGAPSLADLTEEEIFERDVLWLEEVAEQGGILVAEVSTPSLGVGYEIAMARHRYGMPVIALYRPGRTQRCSAMVAGDPGVVLIRYEEASVEEAIRALEAAVGEIAARSATGSVLPA